MDDSSNAYKDWCVVHPPSLEEELVSQLNTPDEVWHFNIYIDFFYVLLLLMMIIFIKKHSTHFY